MALSNWDTLAINEKGESTNGVFVSPLEVSVEIYKNWLYVYDKKAWVEGGFFVQPCVMELQHGELRFKDIEIFAVRGPQQGIYCAVWLPKYRWKDYPETQQKIMVGCGIYGYSGETWTGVLPESKQFLQNFISNTDLPKEINELVISDEVLRFNQGDAYFAEQIGEDVSATKIGESEPTIMSQLIQQLGGSKANK